MDNAYRFAPAAPDEEFVYGAASPGWHTAADHETAVTAWIDFMRARGIQRVCCLLPGSNNGGCGFNLDRYSAAFGERNVVHAPLIDRRMADRHVLEEKILPFLEESVRQQRPVVVHGLSGLGRTGQVLAAWLVFDSGYDPEGALDTVEEMGRFPRDGIEVKSTDEDPIVSHLGTID